MAKREAHTVTDNDPRPPGRQVADIVALFCQILRDGSSSPDTALHEAVTTCSGVVAHEVWDAMIRASDEASTATEALVEDLREFAGRWRSPLLRTFADYFARGRDFPLGYLEACAAAAGAGATERAAALAERRAAHPNHGMPWTEEEREQLRERFVGGASVGELVELHGRTELAIVAKLADLALVHPITHEPAPGLVAGTQQEPSHGAA